MNKKVLCVALCIRDAKTGLSASKKRAYESKIENDAVKMEFFSLRDGLGPGS